MTNIWIKEDFNIQEQEQVIETEISSIYIEDDEYDYYDYDVCRICLKKESLMLTIFTNPNKPPLYDNMINFCTTLQVEKGDNFPDKICSKCSQNLEISFNFKKLAEKSNDVLMNKLFLRKVKKEKTGLSNLKISAVPVKIEFNSIEDIKNKLKNKENILIKKEKIETKQESDAINVDMPVGHNVVICNTVIKRVDKDDMPLSRLCSESKKEKYSDDDYFDNNDDVFAGNDDDDDDDDYIGEVKKTRVKKKIKKLKKSKRSDRKYEQFKIKTTAVLSRLAENKNSPGTADNSLKLKGPINLIKPIPVSDGGDPFIQELTKTLESNGGVLDMKKPSHLRQPCKIRKVKIVNNLNFKPKGPKEKHVCPVCGILTYGLGAHLLTHEEKKPFYCDICKKAFVQKSNYNLHMKKHTGTKDKICEICGAAFFYLKSVIRHKLIHKGIRPFACHLCPKTFLVNCDLTRHLKVHAGYKPYKCVECSMSFNAKHQLITHIRSHTGEKPYTCEICKLSFTYKVNLNNHVFKVHGVNLKFKSIYTVTHEVLNREYQNNHDQINNPSNALTS